ncbi:hypothetical protein AGR8A_pTi20168 [Agrobacterium fabrum str. J-07]|nr:hypothetical protein AGR8A_pTi20168 [Agrobacterium fabrum str. J-07]
MPRERHELSVQCCNLRIQHFPLVSQFNNQLVHARRQVVLLITRKDIQSNLKLATAGRKNETALKEDRPDLIDQRGSLCDQARSNPVQRLDIELLLTLEVDESHCRTRRGFRDALRIPVVV